MSTTVETPTAPLPPAAEMALRSLELKLTATRYRDASALCSNLSLSGDVDGCLAVQDEMAMCRCQLAAAGCLALIEVS